MKLSEYEGEEALDVLADLIEPASAIMSDGAIRKAYEEGNLAKAASVAIRNHKQEVIAILAALDRTPVEEYRVSLLALPIRLIELLNDPELDVLFSSQGQTGDATSSGSASVSAGI